jgi:hypothetical protein
MGPDRIGSPRVPDSYRPGAFVVEPFAVDRASRRTETPPAPPGIPDDAGADPSSGPADDARTTCHAPPALRRFRHPVPVRVAVDAHRPARVTADRPGIASGEVDACAGPWRTSGAWWNDGWDRDEWDVALDDGTICRVYQDRATRGWFMEGIVD